MSAEPALQLANILAPHVHLPDSVELLRNQYRLAKPFRHVVIDNLFSPALLDAVTDESNSLVNSQWLNVEQEGLEKIVRMRSGVELGDAGSRFVGLLHSATFLYLLSEITDVWQLLPDPYLQGGGHALMRRGGYFKVHTDRSVAYDTGLTRRLAMIVFLNKDWRKEYGGDLELWDAQGTRREVSITPDFNRTVIFEVAGPNFHGVPTPLTCPAHQARQSFIVYYHTVGIDGRDNVKPHTSIFAPAFYKRNDSLLHRVARQLTPPLLMRYMRLARARLKLQSPI